MEQLTIKFENLAAQADELAGYYEGKDSVKYKKWKNVSSGFRELVKKVEQTKQNIKAEDGLSEETVNGLKETLEYIRSKMKSIVIEIVSG